MSNFKKSEVLTVSAWLDIATKKLCAPAKERIQIEIESHYADAVEKHLADGVLLAEAHQSAVAELGDPKAALRQFRKNHLTEYEARIVKGSIETSKDIYQLLFYYFVFVVGMVFLVYLQNLSSLQLSLISTGAFLLFILMPTACLLMARFGNIQRYLRWQVLLQSLSSWFAPMIFCMPIPNIWLIGLFLALIRMRFALWHKLGRIGKTEIGILSNNLGRPKSEA